MCNVFEISRSACRVEGRLGKAYSYPCCEDNGQNNVDDGQNEPYQPAHPTRALDKEAEAMG